jgi:16S rRNA (adenine1518-N6/adenine1519-N6)-dimethyltransferase
LKSKNEKNTTGVYAKKSFGQNFLVDQNYIEKIISALNIEPGETIIEIGAGRGALTGRLIENRARVLAIELDRDLILLLQNDFEGEENFRLVAGDALKLDFRQLLPPGNPSVKLVANLPYYISTAILQKLIEQRAVFSDLILMLQREVVERIIAPAGSSERGYLSVFIEAYCVIEKLFDVSPNAFSPIPKVWSSVIRLTIKRSGLITPDSESERLFWQFVGLGFAQKRKTIFNNLKNYLKFRQDQITDADLLEAALESSQINKNRRAETLTLNEWLEVFLKLNKS